MPIAVFTLFYLATPLVTRLQFVRRRAGDIELGELGSHAVLAGPLLLFAFPVLLIIEKQTANPAVLFGTLLGLIAACALHAVAGREGIVYFIGAFAAVAAEAVWSARYLAPERLLGALAIYGVFGLFFIGVPVLSRRRGAPLTPQGAGSALGLVSIALLLLLAGGAVAQSALWGIAILLALLTTGLFAEASATRLPIFAIAGSLLAWLVLAVWWMTAAVAIALIPALSIVGGYSLVTIAGSVWAMRRQDLPDADNVRGLFRSGTFVGLVGHLFLLFVAAEPKLAIPPGPLLATLAVLTAAAGVGALYVKRGELLLGAVIATTAVLIPGTRAGRRTCR